MTILVKRQAKDRERGKRFTVLLTNGVDKCQKRKPPLLNELLDKARTLILMLRIGKRKKR